MPEKVNVTTQAEFDACVAFGNYPVISTGVYHVHHHQKVYATGDAFVYAFQQADIWASGNAQVIAYDFATIHAHENAEIRLNMHAEAQVSGEVKVRAFDNAFVRACGYSDTSAYGNAVVTAENNAIVHVFGLSTVIVVNSSYIEFSEEDNSAYYEDKHGDTVIVSTDLTSPRVFLTHRLVRS